MLSTWEGRCPQDVRKGNIDGMNISELSSADIFVDENVLSVHARVCDCV